MARTPVSILTGFLGSGKTTLLNRALRDARLARTAVVVNEFGQIGLDHQLVEHSDDAVVLLANGCICCAVKSDLVGALDGLHRKRLKGDVPAFDRVVIETSGLSEPTPVIEVLISEPTISARYGLGEVTTTVDAVNGEATLDAHVESLQQAALADRLLLTKTDLASAPAVAALRERLRRLNRNAPVLEATQHDAPADWLLAAPREHGDVVVRAVQLPDGSVADMTPPSPAGQGRHGDDRVRSFTFVHREPVAMRVLELFLDALAKNLGPRLLRVKGLVQVAERPDQPAVLHGAQRLLHGLSWLDRWPSADRRTRIVFITMESDLDLVAELFGLTQRMARVR